MNSGSISSFLNIFSPISLQEMGKVRLMNRIDTKYVSTTRYLTILLNLLSDYYYVQEINGKRIGLYQTLYLDTPDCQFYVNHHNGRLTRQKVRIREYVDSELIFLEVKNKNNHGRTKKKRIAIEQFEFQPDRTSEFLQPFLTFDCHQLSPHLGNQFQRITLVNKEQTERLTIDFNLRFHNLRTGADAFLDNLIIIELKQEGYVYSPIQEYLRKLRIFPMGFSKYCMGCVYTNPTLKQNRFKSKVHKINKLILSPLWKTN